MMKKLLYFLLLIPIFGISQTNVYSYGFGSPTATMTGADGWTRLNRSTSASTTSLWTVPTFTSFTVTAASGTGAPTPFQDQAYGIGSTCPIPNGQAGGPNSFALVNFTSTGSQAATGATISNWLFSPIVNVQNGDVVTFYTRIGKFDQAAYADNLQLRMSTNGAFTTDPAADPFAVGDYTNLLVEVNPNLDLTSYPTTWTQYSYTVAGLSGPSDVKFAFRYFVTDGGPNGNNSDIIGIDSFSVARPSAANQDFFSNNFTLSPNPVNDVFTVNAKNNVAIQNISVTDLNGRVVNEVNNSNSTDAMQVNIANLNAGVYFVKVQTESGVGTSKIIKK